PAHDFDRTRRARHDTGAQRVQLKTTEFGMLEFGDKHRRDPVDYGCLLSINGFERSESIEGGSGEDAGGARDRRGHRADYATKAVEHGDRNASAILFREANVLGEEASVVHQVNVCEQYAFGLAGGAGS